MKKLSNLWWVGAVALIAACDPYSDSVTSPPEVLSTFASLSDGESIIASIDGVAGDPNWSLSDIPDGFTVFFVKYNKTMDGASIQVTPTSCVSAAGVLTVNGAVNPADWFTCYSPSAGTKAEGASMVIYQGADVEGGAGGVGFAAQAALKPGFYAISANAKDKDGRAIATGLDAYVAPNMAVSLDSNDDPLITTTTVDLEWAADAVGATGQTLQRAHLVYDADGQNPVQEPWVDVATLTPADGSFQDTGLEPSGTHLTTTGDPIPSDYIYRIVLAGALPGGPAAEATGPELSVTMAEL